MVMQFQGLENPIQISLPHSHRLSGFLPDVMSLKPGKGRILLVTVLTPDSPSALRKLGCLLLEVRSLLLEVCQREPQTTWGDWGWQGVGG